MIYEKLGLRKGRVLFGLIFWSNYKASRGFGLEFAWGEFDYSFQQGEQIVFLFWKRFLIYDNRIDALKEGESS